MINLEEKYLKQVIDILKKHLTKDVEVYVFGSRTKEKCKQYSDLDLALISGNTKIDSNIIYSLKYDFEESLLPIKVDILDLNDITDSFKKCIEKDLTKLIF